MLQGSIASHSCPAPPCSPLNMRRASHLVRSLAAKAAHHENSAAAVAAACGALRLLAGGAHSQASPLWRLESPLLRHLSNSAVLKAAAEVRVVICME